MGKIDTMVNTAISIAEDDKHGYSQYRRWPSDGTDFDCSSLMLYCGNKAGYDVPLWGNTETMLSAFKKAGFSAIKFSSVGLNGLKKGDILLNEEHHTEIYVGNGKFVGAHESETGGIDGKPGDQTGNEISICPAYVPKYGWDYVLRPPADSSKTTVKPAFRISTDAKGKTWLGKNKLPANTKIRWIAVEGVKKYRVKTSEGWLPYVNFCDIADLDYGCAGDGNLITAIDIRL